jgi:Asp/Glu/hydantoin racemase
MNKPFDLDPIRLFGDYMKVTGVPSLDFQGKETEPFFGKKLGVVHGSSWTTLWANYFGKWLLPGAKIINVGNEAIQLNFMRAHQNHQSCPPSINIDLTLRYAKDLYQLAEVDAILLSCSTMNRAYITVKEEMAKWGVPVVQIDEAMMEMAVTKGGKVCVVATHGPTVESTQSLLRETAQRMGKRVSYTGTTVEEAFHFLGEGDVHSHNEVIAQAIRKVVSQENIRTVILAQLSMSIFSFSYPDPKEAFGVEVLNSGETGFRKAGEVLKG